MDFIKDPNYDFIRWRWHALVFSALLVGAGLVNMGVRGVPLGIDFSGGTLIVVKFVQQVQEDAVRSALESIPGDKVIQPYGESADNEWLIRLPQVEGDGDDLERAGQAVLTALQTANLGEFELLQRDSVGPVIGRDLQLKGIYATLASLVGITIYIGFRFRFSFAVGAVAATLHDILVTLAFLTFFGYELSLNIVAAMLTIAGYSVNDTIVVFDRVRENLRAMRREPLERVINLSVNQTLSRTIITAGTTFIAVLALFVYGGEVLEGFAFAMLIGVVAGTYSTVFIASSLAIILSGKQSKARTAPATRPAAGGRKAS